MQQRQAVARLGRGTYTINDATGRRVRVALAQTTAIDDLDANLTVAREMVVQAAPQGASFWSRRCANVCRCMAHRRARPSNEALQQLVS